MMNRPRRFSGLMFTMLIGLVAFAIAPRSFASGSFASVIAFDTATESLRDAFRLHLGTGIARNGDLGTPLGESRDSDLARSAEAAWKAGDWGQAIRLYQRIAEQGSRDEVDQARLQLAVYAGFVEDPSKAIEALDEVIRRASEKRVVQRAMIEKASLLEIRGEDAEARRLLVAVASEAGSWNLVKKATARLKNLDREHNTDHRESERSAQCGIQSLEKALTAGGFEIAPGELVSRLPDRGNVTSLAELVDAAAELGAQPFGVRLASREASLLNTPFIAHLRSDHFVTVLAAVGDEVEIFDPGRGTFVWTAAQFSRDWSGRALLLSPSKSLAHRAPLTAESRVEGYQTLTPLELRETRGGHHVHGNNLGGSAENGATPFDRGPSPPSPCDSVGLPSLSVNLATFNLVVEDTEFRYGGLGPDIFVRRTYNADDPKVGAFGRSWRFNYELSLEEQPNGGVNLKRGSGRENYFAPLGCTDGVCTYEPPLWSRDELTGNPDGTWDLYLRRSRRTQHFDTSGRLVSITDRNGNSVTLDYDAGGRLTSVTDAAGRVTTFAYGPDGYVSTVVDPAGREASYGYDAEGRLVDHVDMADNVITYTYDEQSYMTSLSTPTGTWSIENVPYADVEFGQVVRSITDPLGHSTTYTTPGFTVVEVEDANGKVWSYFPTGDGEVPLMIDPLGSRTEVTFNEFGEATSVTDASGASLQVEYDGAGNVVSVEDLAGATLHLTYDARNNLTGAVDPIGRVYEYRYDTHDNLTEIRDPTGGVTEYEYDSKGRLTAFSDALGSRTTYQYDSHGDLVAVTTPLGFGTAMTYDAIGRPIEVTNPNGETLEFTYDDLDRLTRVVLPSGQVYSYGYNCCRLSTITRGGDEQPSISYELDAANRLIGYSDARGVELTYGRDPVGRLSSLGYPDGRVVSYDYDASGRMTEVRDWLGNRVRYIYDPAGRLVERRMAGHAVTVYDYDGAGRLSTLANFLPSGEVHSYYRYAFDAIGRRTEVVFTGSEDLSLPSSSASYAYDSNHRLLSTTDSTFSHDPNGNLILEVTGETERAYVYDASGQLLSTIEESSRVDHEYDAIGRRVATTRDGQRTEFVGDPTVGVPEILWEHAVGSSPVRYVYGLGLTSRIVAGQAARFFLFDGSGNVVGSVGGASGLEGPFRYAPFGGSPSDPVTAGVHRFLGAYGATTGERNQVHTLTRTYRTDLGRFLGTDPAQPTPGTTGYSYCGNDPINKFDPDGLDYVHFTFSVGIFTYGLKVGSTGIYGESGFSRGWGKRVAATWNQGNPQTGVGYSRPTITAGTVQIPVFPDNFQDLRRNAKIAVGLGVSAGSATYTFPIWDFGPDC